MACRSWSAPAITWIEGPQARGCAKERLRYMLIGYARVSKADGSQSLDLQRDALRAEGIGAITKREVVLYQAP